MAADDLANGYYGDVAERMSIVRSYDLNNRQIRLYCSPHTSRWQAGAQKSLLLYE